MNGATTEFDYRTRYGAENGRSRRSFELGGGSVGGYNSSALTDDRCDASAEGRGIERTGS
jgi:hypothetical protein